MNIGWWKSLVILMAPFFGAGGPMQLFLQRSRRPGLHRYRPLQVSVTGLTNVLCGSVANLTPTSVNPDNRLVISKLQPRADKPLVLNLTMLCDSHHTLPV